MDCRVPMVIIKIPEAKRVVHKTLGSLNALNMSMGCAHLEPSYARGKL